MKTEQAVRHECACRWKCGFKVMVAGRFVAGHSPASPVPPRMCGCGCGKPTSSALIAFRAGHRPAAARRPARQPVPAGVVSIALSTETVSIAPSTAAALAWAARRKDPAAVVPGSLKDLMLRARLGER